METGESGITNMTRRAKVVRIYLVECCNKWFDKGCGDGQQSYILLDMSGICCNK